MRRQSLGRIRSSRSKRSFVFYLVPLVLLLAAVAALFFLHEREMPQINLLTDVGLIGSRQEISIEITDARSGISHTEVLLRQSGRETKLAGHDFERKGYLVLSAGPDRVDENVLLDSSLLHLVDGGAELVVVARDFSFWNFLRGNETRLIFPLILDTTPPKIIRQSSPQYIKPGGCGFVTYQITEPPERHGVIVNGNFHPGFPLAEKGETFFSAMIGLPWNTKKINDAHVLAEDGAGNIGKAPFGMILRKVKYKRDKLNITDGFLSLKIPEFSQFYPEMSGSPLDKYLFLNNDVRRANNKKFTEVCSVSVPERLWDGSFLRMAKSSNRAGFADQRTYFYQGKKIDEQVHLGIDLASVRHADIQAANSGRVVFTDYVGIYGNTVIVDHGQGVFSLYSHLSQIKVVRDDVVEKGDLLGSSGTSGMTGGDHLHFSMLINGIFVDPLEWWDGSWLEINILSYLR